MIKKYFFLINDRQIIKTTWKQKKQTSKRRQKKKKLTQKKNQSTMYSRKNSLLPFDCRHNSPWLVKAACHRKSKKCQKKIPQTSNWEVKSFNITEQQLTTLLLKGALFAWRATSTFQIKLLIKITPPPKKINK